jgi:translocation and assembly module TamA
LISTGKAVAGTLLLGLAATVAADELQYAVTGIDEPLRANVLAHIDTVQLGRQARLAEKDYPKVIADTEQRARRALRPYGYYKPRIASRIEKRGDDKLLLTLDIRRGPPVKVAEAHIEIVGDGATLETLRDWRARWPLPKGARLDQTYWAQEKVQAIEIAEANGYLSAAFSEQAIELDLVDDTAVLRLTLDTGPRFSFGDVDYGQHALKPDVLESIPRFRKGEPYSARLINEFRADLWKTGYFTNVEIREVRRADATPPEVDLTLKLETTRKNAYQGSLGFGTDTGARLQAQWSRHPVSRNGDRLDFGLGWQEQDDEVSAKLNYRFPRRNKQRQYWIAETTYKLENLDIEIKKDPEDEGFFKIANGDVSDFHVRLGQLRVRNLKRGDRQLFGTAFVQYLTSDQQYDLSLDVDLLQKDYSYLLSSDDDVVSLGYDVALVDVRGKGFDTQGRSDRAWIFASDKYTGSDVNFIQAYVSSRRIYRKGDRWKFLVRGEIGYTDAIVENLSIGVDMTQVDLSVTQLPNFYRFKAGGSQSVRGYGFESLSNNDIGSNHIITASVEAEYRFLEKWSAAAFFDIGNAFNNWSDPELRKGIGVGIRWYSVAGPIRVDVAQALDFTGRPWRVHFTIGTPLL